jgi:selT/selW/selH-like putative selenoprotein
LKAFLEKEIPGISIELIESSGGAFEVKRDNDLIFSKKASGRFPDHSEILKAL